MNLRQIDIDWIVRRLPSKVAEAMKSRPARCFLAGGFLRACIAGEDPKDIDLFVGDGTEARNLALELFGAKDGNPDALASDFAFTGTIDNQTVQVIHRWTFETPADVLAHFDFTIARAIIWWHEPPATEPTEFEPFGEIESDWAGECDPDFYADLAARRLVYTRPTDPEPGGSILRALKFAARGYRMPLSSLGSLLASVTKDVQPSVDLAELTTLITAKLKEVDPGVALEM